MTLKLFNTLTRKKEIFKPIKKTQVGLYACGPTVYNYAHIGNLRTYIFEDILKRTLLYNKLKVKHIMNITDVGHLTSDADEGQDKMDLAVKREHKTPEQIASFYTKAFFDDLKQLNIISPTLKPKATQHIKDMINLIKKIEKNKYTYIGKNGNVYFDTSKFKDYGKLAKLNLEKQKSGARVCIDPDKKHPRDFVLWFSTTGSKFKNHVQNWNSPWGKGWPGWHIECSAMSIKYLGEHFDIHCGGLDHIPIHHPNEIAQSEAATGKKWVNYWLHGEWLIMDKEKMSKSAGGFIRLPTLIEKNFDPLSYRYLCLTTHYRKSLTFSYEALTSAQNSYYNLKERIKQLKSSTKTSKKTESYKNKFLKSVNDDLNMPQALALLWQVLKDTSLDDNEKYILVKEFDKVLGLKLTKTEKIPKEVLELAKQREKARKNKDFKESDSLRDKINKLGYIIEDSQTGFKIKKQ